MAAEESKATMLQPTKQIKEIRRTLKESSDEKTYNYRQLLFVYPWLIMSLNFLARTSFDIMTICSPGRPIIVTSVSRDTMTLASMVA